MIGKNYQRNGFITYINPVQSSELDAGRKTKQLFIPPESCQWTNLTRKPHNYLDPPSPSLPPPQHTFSADVIKSLRYTFE